MNLNDPQLLQQFANSFHKINKKKKEIWRIRVNGDFMRVDSGKCMWNSIGAAKNAVINHLELKLFILQRQSYVAGVNISSEEMPHPRDIIAVLESKGILEFVKDSDDDNI